MKFRAGDIVAVRYSKSQIRFVCIIIGDDGYRYIVDLFDGFYPRKYNKPKNRQAYGIEYIDECGEFANDAQIKQFKKLMLEHQMIEIIET